ncbi:MAG: hypothetical protein ACREOK_00520 [Gemmatimonadaceae bacterium]
MRILTRSLALALAATSVSCSSALEPAATGRFDGAVDVPLGGGLIQTIRVENGFAWDARGDWIEISSRIRNAGDVPITFSQRELCYLETRDLDTDIRFDSRAEVSCAQPRPRVVTLNPGESGDRVTMVAVNASGPGTYRVRVRHVVQPEHWGEITVTIPAAKPGSGAPVAAPLRFGALVRRMAQR